MQNAGMGSVLAISNFGPRAAVPTALFVYVCIFTAAILCEFWKRNRARIAISKKVIFMLF
jgi:predicted Na+-dependent transporter